MCSLIMKMCTVRTDQPPIYSCAITQSLTNDGNVFSTKNGAYIINHITRYSERSRTYYYRGSSDGVMRLARHTLASRMTYDRRN